MDSAPILLSMVEARAALARLGKEPAWIQRQGGPCPVTVGWFLRGRSISPDCHARLSAVLTDALAAAGVTARSAGPADAA